MVPPISSNPGPVFTSPTAETDASIALAEEKSSSDTLNKTHQVCVFWPEPKLMTHSIPDWPSNWLHEKPFLRKNFFFKNTQVIGGIKTGPTECVFSI